MTIYEARCRITVNGEVVDNCVRGNVRNSDEEVTIKRSTERSRSTKTSTKNSAKPIRVMCSKKLSKEEILNKYRVKSKKGDKCTIFTKQLNIKP